MHDAAPDLSKRLFSHIDFSSGAVAAVSGGSDSTALVLLLKRHLDRTSPAARLLAVTIDHDLRQSSAAEARAVASFCAEHGIAHRTMLWAGPKPSTGLPAAAREARYRLLAGVARAEGLGLILTGHTQDDQAETVLMRAARGKTPDLGRELAGRGLAGMAPATLYDWREWIVRPLLGMRRSALREYLRGEHVGWIDDPTNADVSFERPRLRGMLASGDARRVDEALLLAGRMAVDRRTLGVAASALIRRFAGHPVTGLVRLDPLVLSEGDERAAVHALRILMATVGGSAFLPDQARSEALFERLKAGFLCATLSRTVVDYRPAGLFLRREARGLPTAVEVTDGTIWDGRRRIASKDKAGTLKVAPAGRAATLRVEVRDTPMSLLRAASAVEPALLTSDDSNGPTRRAREMSEISEFSEFSAEPVVAPFARFLSCFDLAPAQAVAELIGAASFPAPPFSGHSAE
jgi:tRNA(Ile)-lysidine synthase